MEDKETRQNREREERERVNRKNTEQRRKRVEWIRMALKNVLPHGESFHVHDDGWWVIATRDRDDSRVSIKVEDRVTHRTSWYGPQETKQWKVRVENDQKRTASRTWHETDNRPVLPWEKIAEEIVRCWDARTENRKRLNEAAQRETEREHRLIELQESLPKLESVEVRHDGWGGGKLKVVAWQLTEDEVRAVYEVLSKTRGQK